MGYLEGADQSRESESPFDSNPPIMLPKMLPTTKTSRSVAAPTAAARRADEPSPFRWAGEPRVGELATAGSRWGRADDRNPEAADLPRRTADQPVPPDGGPGGF